MIARAEDQHLVRGESQVLIVGAGPAGCSAGIVLARAGVDVTVIDRARFPRDKTCGDAVSNLAMGLIDQLGAGEEVRQAPHALVERGVAAFPDGTRIERRYDRPGYIVPRLSLDHALKQALVAAGARVIEGRRVDEIEMGAERVTGVRGRGIEWSAPLVIAADGYGSVGLAPLGRDKPQRRLLAVSMTAYYRGIRYPFGERTADHSFEHDLPCGYGWIFPEVDGVANVGVYVRQDRYRRSGKPLARLLDDFIARHPDRFAAGERVGKSRVWSLPIGPSPRPAAGRGIILVGDVGGFVDPLSGEGIWQALFTGMTAGEVALEATGGELTSALCERYEVACDEHVRGPSRKKAAVQNVMRLIMRGRLYRTWPVRAALRSAYRRRSFEMTKA